MRVSFEYVRHGRRFAGVRLLGIAGLYYAIRSENTRRVPSLFPDTVAILPKIFVPVAAPRGAVARVLNRQVALCGMR